MRDIVLVVGNGLPIDLRSTYPSLQNPSQPLSINIIPDHHFWNSHMDSLDFNVYYPHLMEVLSNFGSEDTNISHFNIIKNIIVADVNDDRFTTNHIIDNITNYFNMTGKQDTWWTSNRRKGLALSQLRLYLIYVFSYFDKSILDEYLIEWRWTKWMMGNINRISQIVSFNYDLVIDRALNMLSIADYVLSEKDVKTRIKPLMISKPHGSINHIMRNVIDTGQTYWNMPSKNGIFEFNQGDVSVIPRNRLYDDRQFSDMILPTEAPGARRKMRHINNGYRRLQRVGRNADICVIAGLSYSEPDRLEINEIINLVPRAEFLICDPEPSTELIKILSSYGRKCTPLYGDLPNI